MAIDLVGQVPAEIDHKIAVTITNLTAREATPTTVKKGALGPIGTAQGIPDVSGTFNLAAPKTGLELNLEALAVKPTGFVLSFTQGVNRWAITGCKISERSLSVDNGQGNVEWAVNFTGLQMIRTA